MTEVVSFEARPGGASVDGPSEALLGRMSQAKTRAVRAGQLAPTFRLRELGGSSVALIDLVAEGPLVLSFYRGSWCDFCETALERLSAIDGDIRALGAQQVVIGPPPANEVQANRLTGLAMTVLADAGLDVTTAYGLTVGLPREDHGRYLELGFKPAGLSDRTKWFVSIPATYVVDRLGRVVMAAIDTDYRNRLEGREILSALRALRERSGG